MESQTLNAPCKHAGLIRKKEDIKEMIMKPMTWEKRMDLYSKVQCIKHEIESCPRKCFLAVEK
jgi:hypothetical protein